MGSRRPALALLAAAGILGSGPALADCSVDVDVVAEHAKGQAAERAGRAAEALTHYARAQSYNCGPNPVEADAARRAAPLAPPLARAAEKAGDFVTAQSYFEMGGYFADGDRMVLANVHAHPDDPDLVRDAISHFESNALPALQANFAARIAVVGPYVPNTKALAEMLAAPAKGAERAFQREVAAFDARYLADRVRFDQSTPDPTFDAALAQQAFDRQAAFETKWPEDPLERSHAQLTLVRGWTIVERDPAIAEKLDARRVQRQRERSATLVQRYSGSPKLLEEAFSYQLESAYDRQEVEPQLKRILALALALGDAAYAEGRFNLAGEYYSAADEREKAHAARERAGQLARQKMQPQIDQANAQMEKMRAFNNPARVEQAKQQAAAAKKALEAGKKSEAQAAKEADDLEAELGL